MKIVVDNQSKITDSDSLNVAGTMYGSERDFIHQCPSGCHFKNAMLKITINVWQDSEGLNFKITDLKGDGK